MVMAKAVNRQKTVMSEIAIQVRAMSSSSPDEWERPDISFRLHGVALKARK
jgi:hypothetical protein